MMSAILLVIITFFIPPIGVFIISGCGVDLLINICLTILGYIPGHIHAFYLEYVYYKKQEAASTAPAAGVYSENVQTGGQGGYGTIGTTTQQHV